MTVLINTEPTMPKLHCGRCHGEWNPRPDTLTGDRTLPLRCPLCGAAGWNEPYANVLDPRIPLSRLDAVAGCTTCLPLYDVEDLARALRAAGRPDRAGRLTLTRDHAQVHPREEGS